MTTIHLQKIYMFSHGNRLHSSDPYLQNKTKTTALLHHRKSKYAINIQQNQYSSLQGKESLPGDLGKPPNNARNEKGMKNSSFLYLRSVIHMKKGNKFHHLRPSFLPFSIKYLESWKWSGSLPQDVQPAPNSLAKSSIHFTGLVPGIWSHSSS